MSSFSESTRKLCEASTKAFLNPYTYIDWPEAMEAEQWFMSPELISIFALKEFKELSEEKQKVLSFYEAVNFFSLNIHGEKSLVEGLSRRLYSRELSDFVDYLHHFLDEENKHMIYFGGFCRRYAGKIYRDRKFSLSREYEKGEEDFLFFAKVMIFEEIVDGYNIVMSSDARLEPTAAKINLIHHLEEARHLVFGRQVVQYLFQKYRTEWRPETLSGIREYLSKYIVATWKEYYNPDVYKDALLEAPFELMETAWNNPVSVEHRRKHSAKLMKFLKENEMIEEEPAL